MNEPLSFYVAPKGATPNPVGKVDPEQVSKWSAQTEVQPGKRLCPARWPMEGRTGDDRRRNRHAGPVRPCPCGGGYAVRIKPRTAEGGGYRYAVRVTQLASKAEAEILSSKLAGTLELASTVVTRY